MDGRTKIVTIDDLAEFKGRLRQLGNYLRDQVRLFKQKYDEEDIAFERIDEGSKMINRVEEKMGNYLSLIKKNERIEDRYTRIMRIKKKHEEKLASATSVWLQKYSPHVIEITSYNRAKYVAESLVHVFEHQWQEMYTSSRNKLVSRVTDRGIMECLMDILKYCFHRCQDFAWRQTVLILELLTMSSQYNIENCHPVIRLRIKELQKNGVSYTLPFMQKVIRQDILSQLNFKTIAKAHHTQRPPFRTFLDMCTEVTWFMQLQEPPIVLDFTVENSSAKFNPYTTSGPEIAFVVWPAVLLQEHGLTLTKGFAEFFDPGPEGVHKWDSQQGEDSN